MSKLLVSSSCVVTDHFKGRIVESGFLESTFKQSNGLFLTSFKKLKVDNVNYYEKDDSFVAIAGTLIYKEKIGKDSLEMLLSDFCQHQDINALRKETIGNYMCVVKNGNTLTAFCDSRNIFELYYFKKESIWALSNSLLEMAESLGGECITVNESALLEEMYSRCIWGDETVFNEIKRLSGDEYITINLANGEVKLIENPNYGSCVDQSFNEAVTSFSDGLSKICSVVKKVYGTLSIAMTGGMDSRSVLAGLLSQSSSNSSLESLNTTHLTLLYGIGNSQLIETKNADKRIIDDIAERFSLPKAYLNWSTPEPINQAWPELASKYGFLGRVYSGSSYMHNSLESRDDEFIAYGYFGESYSFEDTLLSGQFKLDDFLNYYIGNKIKSISKDYKKYRNHISNKIEATLKKYKINPNKISINDWILLELEMRRKKDTVMVRLSNQHRYSFAILGEESLLRYAYCPISFKKNRKFLLNMIKINCPVLLDIPIYSHGEERTLDYKRMELTTPFIMRVRDIMKKYLKITKLRQIALRISKRVLDDKKSVSEINKIDDMEDSIKSIYSNLSYKPHDIFAVASTNLSLEARYVYTAMLLQKFNKNLKAK